MTGLSLSRFFSSSSSDWTAGYNSNQVSQVLTFRPSPDDQNVTLIQREGHHRDTTPLYTITTSKTINPNIRISRVVAISTDLQKNVIGGASLHSLSSTIDLYLHGQSIKMKPSSLSGSYNFIYPPTGKMKWKYNLMGTALELFDSRADQKLARYKLKFSGNGGKRLEVLVPCDNFFLDLIVLSGMAAAVKEHENLKVIAETSQAVAGV